MWLLASGVISITKLITLENSFLLFIITSESVSNEALKQCFITQLQKIFYFIFSYVLTVNAIACSLVAMP